jgi:hypothetical protein
MQQHGAEKRLLQYLNEKGFGNRYTGNAEGPELRDDR